MDRRELLLGSVAGAVALAATTEAWGEVAEQGGPVGGYRELIRARMAQDRLQGVSVALVRAGQLVWAEGFGQADRENAVAMTPDTVVGIGSITKTFTALALMQLQRRGLIDIDRPVTDYVPDLRIGSRGADLRQVTVRAVMNHTSGLPSDIFKDTELERARYTDVVDLLNGAQLAAWPGTTGLYSNIGYSLLGVVIRNVSGEDYPDYVRRHILLPWSMSRSGFATEPELPARTRLYYQDGRPAPPFELRDQPAGGLYADVKDMARYATAMMQAWRGRSDQVIDAASVRAMFRLSNDGVVVETNNKGLGWFMFRDGAAFAMYHAGSTGFCNASLLLIPEKQVAVATLANTVGGDGLVGDLAFRVLEDNGLRASGIRPRRHLPPAEAAAGPVRLSAAVLDAHVGDYVRKRSYATVKRDGDGLTLTTADGVLRLLPMSDGSFQPFSTPQGGAPSTVEDERYRFTDVGPYHLLFRQSEAGEQQQGYRIPPAPLDARWRARVGRYEIFGYQLAGAEKILAAEVELIDDRLPRMALIYNTGRYNYPLVVTSAVEAITGGLGPETTGETVRFEDHDQVLVYSGLTFRRAGDRGADKPVH